MDNRKELIRKYKEAPKPMGIFQIKNLKNNKIYIESSKNLDASINKYKFLLKYELCKNISLQNDWNKFGDNNFIFEVIDTLKPKEEPDINYSKELKTLEELWLEKLNPYNENGYNRLSC